jgi:hypothetical protein
MIDNINHASVHAHAAYVQVKAQTLNERIRRLSLHNGSDIAEVLAKQVAKPSVVKINLRNIAQLLHLTEREKAWLETAYVWTLSGLALPDLEIEDDAIRWHLLAGVLDQPVSPANPAWPDASHRLRSLALIAPRCYRSNSTHWLSDDLRCYPSVIRAISSKHASHAHLLNNLLLPSLDLSDDELLFSHWSETVYLVTPLPLVDDAYQRDRSDRPMTATHLVALLNWWCDWPVEGAGDADAQRNTDAKTAINANDLRQLAGHLNLLNMRSAIQAATRSACILQKPLTAFDLLKALYEAAS